MNIGIIGAGATGLTAGYTLSKKGHKVTIFEAEDACGGLVASMKIGDTELEQFYHHIFTSDNDILDLIEELGLKEHLKWLPSKSGIYINDKLYPFSTPMDLLRFKELSFIDRVSMGLLVYKAKFIEDWKSLETMNSKEWIINKSSERVYEKVWGPLLNSKFDVDADKVSAVWIWNKFKLRGSTREKNLNKELLGYMEGSFGKIYKKMEQSILQAKGEFVFGAKVEKIDAQENGAFHICTQGKEYNFDKVIVTTAPKTLKDMGLPFSVEYTKRLEKIKYKSNICMMIELKESISPYYWTTIADEEIPFVLMIEHTNLISKKDYKANIVYLSRYLDETNEMFSYSDEMVKSMFISGLKKIFPLWDEAKIISSSVYRSRFSQPVVNKEYSKIKLEYEAPIKNLYLANMSQIYPEDRGQNYAIRMGKEIAEVVCSNSL
jgi:protoporphyrinogen oxidase